MTSKPYINSQLPFYIRHTDRGTFRCTFKDGIPFDGIVLFLKYLPWKGKVISLIPSFTVDF